MIIFDSEYHNLRHKVVNKLTELLRTQSAVEFITHFQFATVSPQSLIYCARTHLYHWWIPPGSFPIPLIYDDASHPLHEGKTPTMSWSRPHEYHNLDKASKCPILFMSNSYQADIYLTWNLHQPQSNTIEFEVIYYSDKKTSENVYNFLRKVLVI